MQHPDVKLILATGGPGMVKAAYSSGHPSLGVGAGNTPAVIDASANIQTAVSSILLSKTLPPPWRSSIQIWCCICLKS